jgi:hypothetical protein
MDRETRNLIHEKGGRIREVNYLPIKSDGQDGDARIYKEDLYIKTKGNWVKLMSGDKLINQEITRNIDFIISEGVVQHSSLTGVTANQHHAQAHAIDGSDHTGTLTVAKGGTGATALTDKAVLITQDSGTDTVATVAMDASGELLIGGTSGPAVGTITADDGLAVTVGDGTIELDLDLKSAGGLAIESNELALSLGDASITGTLAVGDGGTGVVNSNSWLNSRITTNANGSLNYDATGATAVNHDNLAGFVANEHIDHSGVTLTAGAGLSGGGTIASNRSFAVDISEFSDVQIASGDKFLVLDSDGSTEQLESVDDVATFMAGAGMTATSGVLNVIAGTGIDVTADAVAVDVSDFMSNGNNNYVVTATGADAMNAESGLTFSGTALTLVDDGTMQSSSFASGFTGHGWRILDSSGTAQGAAASGNASATFDTLLVRGTMSVYEMLIQQVRATNGSLIVSSAAKVESVANYSSGTDEVGDITFESTVSGTKTCPFIVNDIIMSQRVDVNTFVPGDETYNGSNIVAKKVLKVTAVSQNVVTTGDAGFASGTAPAAGDEFVRIGNTGTSDANVARQGILYLTSDDEDAPFIDVKSGVDTYAKWDAATSTKVRIGKLKGITGVEEEYGLWAGVSGTQYLKATSVGLEIHSTAALYTAYTGSEINFHDGSANPKMTIGAGNITMFADDSTTAVAVWNDDVITLGKSANEHVAITGSSMAFKDGGTTMMSLAAGDISMTGKINITSTGSQNVMMGVWAATDPDVSGVNDNVVLGVEAGRSMVSGATENVLIGTGAGYTQTNTDYNVYIGYNAGYYGTSNSNVICGRQAGYYSTGAQNVYQGLFAGYGVDGETNNGSINVALGVWAGKFITAGASNVCIGEAAGAGYNGPGSSEGISTGSNNVCIGPLAGYKLTTGEYNIQIGGYVAASNGDHDEQIAIGRQVACSAGEQIRIGDSTNYLLFDFSSSGAVTVTSDMRVKQDIVDTDLGLEFINALRPIKYTPKEKHEYPDELFGNGVNEVKEGDKAVKASERRMEGFIAQEVKQAMDDLNVTFSGWHQNESSRQMLGYSTFVVPLVKAVQELSAKVTALEAQIN